MHEVIAHSTAGSGDDLLLLNGGLMSMGGWAEIATPLELDHRVTRCDFRGQLLSPGEAPSDLYGHADDVIRLLDFLGIGRVDLVGASFGAMVGVIVAARFPERVRSLVAMTLSDVVDDIMWSGAKVLRDASLAAAAGGDREKVLDLLLGSTFSREFIEANPGRFALQRMALPLLPPGYFEGFAAIVGALEGLDLREEAAAINAPTLVIAAGDDQMFPLEHSYHITDTIPGARLAIVPGSGHGLVIEKPGVVVALIREFLSRNAS